MAVWGDSVLPVYPREREVEYQVHLAGRELSDDDAMRWKTWIWTRWRPKKHDGIKKRSVGAVDISRNALGYAGLLHILEGARCLGGSVRVLKAQANKLEDIPTDYLLATNERLVEMHLSHNLLPSSVLQHLIAAVIACKRYPLDSRPMWMRIEKNPGCAKGVLDGCAAAHESNICVVDGHHGCTPHACHLGRRSPPCIHLTYVKVSGFARPASARDTEPSSEDGPGESSRPQPIRHEPRVPPRAALNAWTPEAQLLRWQRSRPALRSPGAAVESETECGANPEDAARA